MTATSKRSLLSTKSLLSQNRVHAPRMKSCLPVIVRPDRHSRLPHSTSTKPPRSREVRFDKVVTKLLGLPGPTKSDMRPIQLKPCPPGPKRHGCLIDTDCGYHIETSEFPLATPHPSLTSAPISPICLLQSYQQT
jgi:hypothetical protein